MALDTEPASVAAPELTHTGEGATSGVKALIERLRSRMASDRPLAARVVGRLARMRVVRFVSATLWRRILAANLVGLLIILGGFHFFWPEQVWVIDAKRDSLTTQAEIIATAIASDLRLEGDSVKIDTTKPPEGESSRAPYRDDAFRSLELSIRPELVTPILRRLIQPTKTRARIYDKGGTLIVDSAALLTRGKIARPLPAADSGERPRMKNFWTRLTAWLIDKELPVYTEIGSGRGTAYPEVRRALTGSSTAMLLLSEKGEQIVSVAVPIQRRNAVQGVLLLSTRPGDVDERIWEGRVVLWVLFGVALLATLASTFWLAQTVAGPMRRLSESADHVSHNIAARQELPDYADRSDEVGQMATAFKSMTAALYRRIEASENFAADVAHELKNPLTAARSTAESLGYAKSPEQRQQLVQQIQFELKRLNRLISDVSNASRLDAELARQKSRPIDVVPVLESVTQIFCDILQDDTRRVKLIVEPVTIEAAYTINGDDGRLGQVVTNLVDNAVSFSPEDGTIYIRVRRKGPNVLIMVDDEGPGIPEDRQKIIFDRFYTDRPATEALRGKNSGLGLSISREIVRAHGGEIWAENRPPAETPGAVSPLGARFVVRLPALVLPTRGGMTLGRRA
ncbi:MAG: stimulus-sensing domain-containing protein [Hyphomicrobium sp.]